jgi:hypothetical protein
MLLALFKSFGGAMKNLHENNLIRFKTIVKSKEGLFAKFEAKGVRGGTSFTASITVDFSEADVDPTDTLEKIVEKCALIAESELKKTELLYEGIAAI